ncbi:uncharacterized protein B0H18DRAFT_1122441 [Fomitopsis serialis]|uniref:uncharacterized protein n=1 Tax=Fomitopsis serialis TaxID=139415 RepID=UPI0020081281|nr:uncharacterized protein B0H18DRAFT_1122441 [Neoantrodia serialis]KAH9919518.1 hypothetical protein B0H18DRAFT_1122441 [Neoantrodia serialis]
MASHTSTTSDTSLPQPTIPASGLPVGSCTADIPCANGACCNANSGFCGYGPEFCTPISSLGGNCTSNCNAVAECGQYAPPVNRTCPLNVCCSQYGFCGTTSDFCGVGCQSDCNPVPPTGGGDDISGGGATHRRIGYYEGWAVSSSRSCDYYEPEQIAVDILTHVNYAFALISSAYEIIEMSPGDQNLWSRTTALKQRNSALKVFLSVATLHWSFNDPPTSTIFSQLVASTENTNTFVKSALNTMQAYGFDGIDIDWEYPAAYDRGGNPADTDNYVAFMKALRTAFGGDYGISFTAPSSYWYLQHFNLTGLLHSADFVNVMTYDLHGVWDGNDPYIGSIVLAHTNLTEIKSTLQLFQNVDVDWSQVNIGFGFYGRSFELATAECTIPGCPFSGPGDAGPCTHSPGTLSFAEIEDIINDNDLDPVLDEDAAVKYIVWNDRQWVSYDDAETFKLKMDYLETIVGGSFIWSVDQDDTQYTALTGLYPDIGINNASSTQTNECQYTGCGFTGCHWVGTPPACTDAACAVGEVSVFQDIQGDASSTCTGKARRNYCCTPPASEEFLPVPEDWVIPLGQGYGADQPASFTADFDDNTGPSDTTSQGAGFTGISDDGQENDSPFGEVFITSPNAQSVSSLDVQSDWVLVGCDGRSDQAQTVLAYCSMPIDDDNAGCGHVFIGQAQHTIVRMPSSCGAGPYARVVSMEVHQDQTALPAAHQASLPATEKVYSLAFDYQFDAIPEDNGPVYMRADITDIPGYWDEMIDSLPDSSPTSRKRDLHYKRNFHQPLEYEKRWFGGFTEWLQRLNTITNGNSISRNFHWSDTYTIYHAQESCPNFESSLDISVYGNAQISSQFGYYLEATVVPPAIQQAYVYVDVGASASATFTIQGLAKAEWNSGQYELISFGFPGLYYPGLLTLGPSLHLYAELSGEISLTGQLSTTVGYTVHYALGSTSDEPTLGPNLTGSTANNNGYNYDFGYNVELSGGLTAYLTPSLELGLTVLGGSVMDATAYVQAELYAGLILNGSVSETQSPKICIQPQYGVNLHGGLKGAVVWWNDQWDNTFYQNTFDFGGACYDSASSFNRRDGQLYAMSDSAASGNTLPMQHRDPHAFYSRWEHRPDVPRAAEQPTLPIKPPDSPEMAKRKASTSSLGRRDTIPYLPGSLFCPEESSDLDQTNSLGQDCICYSDTDMDPTGQLIDVLARRYLSPDDAKAMYANTSFINKRSNISTHPVSLAKYAKLQTCDISVSVPEYASTNIIAYYDHENPGTLSPTMGSYTQLPLNLGGNLVTATGKNIYAREHVYEMSLSSLFVDYLAQFSQLWQTAAGLSSPASGIDFCAWVEDNLVQVPAWLPGSQSLFSMIGNCYPGYLLNGATGSMVILEQTANEIKNTAFYDGEQRLDPFLTAKNIRSQQEFADYCPQKQVAVIRAAAGIPSFLNQYPVRQEASVHCSDLYDIDSLLQFLTANTCIRSAWTKWYAAYLAANVDAPDRDQVDIPTLYDNWISSIMKNMKPYLVNQITTLISYYDDTVNGQAGGAPPVDLSFYILMDNNQVLNAQGQPLYTPAAVYTVQQPYPAVTLKGMKWEVVEILGV